jgi:hypothetical protein
MRADDIRPVFLKYRANDVNFWEFCFFCFVGTFVMGLTVGTFVLLLMIAGLQILVDKVFLTPYGIVTSGAKPASWREWVAYVWCALLMSGSAFALTYFGAYLISQ